MLRSIFPGILALMLALGSAALANGHSHEATLYKNPDCGCCDSYADYLRMNGFSVVVKPTDELAQMNRLAGIPEGFEGCHLAMIDGYVISGHVPVNVVERLIAEQPEITGITLPGMPSGSPGMSGPKSSPFEIYQIATGSPRIYAVD